MRKKSIQIYLEPAELECVKKIAAASKRSISQAIGLMVTATLSQGKGQPSVRPLTGQLFPVAKPLYPAAKASPRKASTKARRPVKKKR